MFKKLKAQSAKCKTIVQNLKVLSFTLLLYALTFTLFTSSAYAQANTSTSKESTQSTVYNLPSTVNPTSPLYTDLLVNNLFHSFSCLAIGQSMIGQPCLTYQVTKNAEGVIQSVPVLSSVNLSGGTLGAVTSVIGALYINPPVRTADYLASVGQGLGIVKEANAQGVVGSGEAVLHPILSLWQVSRNVSYVIMIIIFLVIGLMVMFRNRINPQTVITAQAALPGLVIGLILITFSYFLAGLISDMAFVGTNVVGYYFSTAQGTTQNLVEDTKYKNVLSIFSPFTGILNKDNVSDALSSIWKFLETPNKGMLDMDPARALTALSTMMITQLLMPFGGMFGGIGQIAVALGAGGFTLLNPTATVGIALSFIAMVILIYAMFKLLLRLINNYITIIFLTITAPFQLLASALPGRQEIATGWILNMLANVLAFPAVLAVLYFVAFLIGPSFINQRCPECPFKFKVSQVNQTEQNALVPAAYAQGANTSKITGKATFPLFGGMDLSFINLLLAFGALVALPSIPDIIGRTIGRMSQAGQMIGQEIGGGMGAGQRYAGQFQQGVGGMAGQVGRVTEEPGLLLTQARNEKGETIPDQYTWRRPAKGDISEQYMAGTRAGQRARLQAGMGNLFSGIKQRLKR